MNSIVNGKSDAYSISNGILITHDDEHRLSISILIERFQNEPLFTRLHLNITSFLPM